MNKNPFSIYDFMGYLFPGMMCYIMIAYCFRMGLDMSEISNFENLRNLVKDSQMGFNLEKSVIIIVIAYILGHIMSYLSSVTIELFARKVFGYPSEYLLERERGRNWGRMLKAFFASEAKSSQKTWAIIKTSLRVIMKVFMALLLFPITFSTFTFAYFFDINGWIVRPLDEYLKNTLKVKEFRLANRLGINHPDVNQECDYHRIVMHYVYLNIPNSQRKTDNYIALYGFLRSISFVFCLTFFAFGAYALTTIDCSESFDRDLLFTLFLFFTLSYICFLGFVKFYRRFTLENYMAMLTAMPDDGGKCSL
ncbi:hypothetical protein SAMN04487827_2231 [Prevotella sp. khp7]|uniref:hypothetical protein n=1 Tax=Prevotella sp. khp7 TaxID=1761885 RepID=UPI0008CFCDDC|nr:hypothetical protein [Prevotella sp. khp7]SEW23527.1 hypothetical protein SAMN04487827_2231 [Prevotella sp. khp7]